MGGFAEMDIEEQESGRWQENQNDEMEYADYLLQLHRDDELLEKANEQLRSLRHDNI